MEVSEGVDSRDQFHWMGIIYPSPMLNAHWTTNEDQYSGEAVPSQSARQWYPLSSLNRI